jgi:hypothetical protein
MVYLRGAEERRYLELAKMNERFERAYVLQAVENATAPRRHKTALDRERHMMRNHPDWVVNQSPYFTDRAEAPTFDELDPRLADPASGRSA